MKFTLNIESGNAAMIDDVEGAVSEILERVAEQVIDRSDGSGIFDANGNRVGSWTLES